MLAPLSAREEAALRKIGFGSDEPLDLAHARHLQQLELIAWNGGRWTVTELGAAASTAWQIRHRLATRRAWGDLMQLKLSDLEIEILRELVNGEAVSISSQQRVRLELAGMIRERAKGIVVTLTGRRLASEKSSEAAASDAALGVKVSRDSRSRRTPLRRRSIF
jgi:hypothetical protein